MNDTAAHLVDRVLPDVPVRQYVLSLPHKYRFLIARNTALVQAVLGVFIAVVFAFLRRRAKDLGIKDPRPGAISSVQRFGDGLVFNLHYHCLLLDGVYHRPDPDQAPVFVALPPPTQEEVAQVAQQTRKKVERLLRKRGVLTEDDRDADGTLWEKLCAASVQGRIALGPKTGWRVTRIGGQPVLLPPGPRHLVADVDGFNVHAHTHVGAGKRDELERLARYVLRPAISNQRLSLTPTGDVLWSLKRPWSDGTTALLFKPLEFIEKLAVIVPPPRKNLITYAGVLAANAAFRAEIIPRPKTPDSAQSDDKDPIRLPDLPPQRPRRLPWADLLRRCYEIDILVCPRCQGPMKLLAVVLQQDEVVRLCESLGEAVEPPQIQPSKYQVQTSWEFSEPP